MAYEQKPGQVTVFKNNKTTDKHPDYRGELTTPQGEKLEISLWIKEGQKGKFFSGVVKAPYGKSDSNFAKPADKKVDYQAPLSHDGDMDSEIPFAKVPHIAAPY